MLIACSASHHDHLGVTMTVLAKDPPLDLPDPTSPTEPIAPASFLAHLQQFVAPPSSLRPKSPRESISNPIQIDRTRSTSSTPDVVVEPIAAKSERRVRSTSTRSPPLWRADQRSPHFSKRRSSRLESLDDAGSTRPEIEAEMESESGRRAMSSSVEPELVDPSPKKRKRPARTYADPSQYSELGSNPLTDHLEPNLDLVLCGINPGLTSARRCEHYASPTNHFWKCLAGSGFTDGLLPPSAGPTLPELYGIGLTNLVPRPSAEMSELSTKEMQAEVPNLLKKIVHHKPRVFAFVGMKICEIVFRYLVSIDSNDQKLSTTDPGIVAVQSSTPPSSRRKTTRETPKKKRKPAMPKIRLGLQPFTISVPTTDAKNKDEDDKSTTRQGSSTESSRTKIAFWCLPSTSARVVAYQLTDKIRIFSELKQDVQLVKLDQLEFPQETIDYRMEDLKLDQTTVKIEERREEEQDDEKEGKSWQVTLIESPSRLGSRQEDVPTSDGMQGAKIKLETA
ncbi:mismatch-specific DNA-glycosylase [Sporobolomyces koalae]|uniref:mismatch-specific DNA-glycosylase n=1 Tax=Sporobolomyces koalae TaxID=500713 RepID=UPI00316E038B